MSIKNSGSDNVRQSTGLSVHKTLCLSVAGVGADAALNMGEELGVDIAVVVVSPFQDIVTCSVMDAAYRSAHVIALRKAQTAANFGQATSTLQSWIPERSALELASLEMPFLTIPGGVPVVYDEEVIGAFGVSGATAEQDHVCAEAGVDAVLASLSGS